MNYGHGPLADHARMCTADVCGQDPRRCPCPEACRLSVDSMKHYTRWRIVVAAVIVALCALVALWMAK